MQTFITLSIYWGRIHISFHKCLLIYSYTPVLNKNLTKITGADKKSQKLHLCTTAFGTLSVRGRGCSTTSCDVGSFSSHTRSGPQPHQSLRHGLVLSWEQFTKPPQHTGQLKGSRRQIAELVPTPCPKIIIYVFNTTEVCKEKRRRELEKRRADGWMPCSPHVFMCQKTSFSLIFNSVPCGRFSPALVMKTARVLNRLHNSSLHLLVPVSTHRSCWHRGRWLFLFDVLTEEIMQMQSGRSNL